MPYDKNKRKWAQQTCPWRTGHRSLGKSLVLAMDYGMATHRALAQMGYPAAPDDPYSPVMDTIMGVPVKDLVEIAHTLHKHPDKARQYMAPMNEKESFREYCTRYLLAARPSMPIETDEDKWVWETIQQAKRSWRMMERVSDGVAQEHAERKKQEYLMHQEAMQHMVNADPNIYEPYRLMAEQAGSRIHRGQAGPPGPIGATGPGQSSKDYSKMYRDVAHSIKK